MSSHIISRKHSVPNFWKLILGLEIIVWIPIIFIGFDSHHDGLILTNVNLLKFDDDIYIIIIYISMDFYQ
jgi:hypothetical protein